MNLPENTLAKNVRLVEFHDDAMGTVDCVKSANGWLRANAFTVVYGVTYTGLGVVIAYRPEHENE